MKVEFSHPGLHTVSKINSQICTMQTAELHFNQFPAGSNKTSGGLSTDNVLKLLNPLNPNIYGNLIFTVPNTGINKILKLCQQHTSQTTTN